MSYRSRESPRSVCLGSSDFSLEDLLNVNLGLGTHLEERDATALVHNNCCIRFSRIASIAPLCAALAFAIPPYLDGMRHSRGMQTCHADSVPAASPLVVAALPSLGTFIVHHGEGIFCVDPEQGKNHRHTPTCL